MKMLSQDIFFSFIVVAKNSEATINRCVDSLLSQPFASFEVLIVLDTYSDTTLPVAEQIAQKDSRVRVLVRDVDTVVCQLGNARNYGLSHALGKWIWFIDSDDWMAANSLTRISSILTSNVVDLLVCNMAWAYPERGVIKTTNPLSIDKKYSNRLVDYVELHANIEGLFSTRILGQDFLPCWRAVVSKAFLVENGIRFQENVAHEDNIFAMAVWLLVRRVYVDTKVAYLHYDSRDSASRRRHASARQLIEVGRKCFVFLEQFEENPSLSTMIKREKLKAILQRYHYSKNLLIQERREFLRLLNQEIDTKIEHLVNRYGDELDIAFFYAARQEDPERYALEEMLQTINDRLNHLERHSLRGTLKTLERKLRHSVRRVALGTG